MIVSLLPSSVRKTHRRTRSARYISTLSLLCIGACSGSVFGTPGVSTRSTFAAMVTGAFAGSYTGVATASESNMRFLIALTTSTSENLKIVVSGPGSTVPIGTHQLTSNLGGFIGNLSVDVSGSQVVYVTTSGTLTITQSSGGVTKGTFSFIGTPDLGMPPSRPTVNVTGSFTATCTTGC